jgi:hypothetical protein
MGWYHDAPSLTDGRVWHLRVTVLVREYVYLFGNSFLLLNLHTQQIQVMSGQVTLLLATTQSVLTDLEPLIVTYGHILAWKKTSVLSFVRCPPVKADGAAMYWGHSFCVMYMFILLRVRLSRFDIIIYITIINVITIITIIYKGYM